MRISAVRYSFYVDDGVTGEIGAETAPGGQQLTDEQRALLERIQQLVAQAQAALTSSSGAEAMVSGIKLANAVNGLKASLANFQTAMRTGDTSSQKSTAQSVVGAATEFQKTLDGIKTANPNGAIPANLKSLGASLAGLKDMMSQKAQVGKITRTAVLRGGVTDLAAARILSAIKAIISDKTQPQAVRDVLTAVSKALDIRKTAGQPLTVKDIVQVLAGKGQDSVNAVVTALAVAKQPAATQAVVVALANIPEKGTQMAALATVAVAQVSQQIAAQVITHVATVNPQAAAQIMTTVAAVQPAVIQSVAQTAIQTEKPSIVAMALAALTEVKQQQPAATQAIQNIAVTLADKGQPAVNAVAVALAELKQPAAAQALRSVITTLSETKPQMAAQAIAELAKSNPQIAAKVITQLAEANPQTATQIMTSVAALQPNVIQAIAQQTVRGEPSPLAAAAQAVLAEVKLQQSGRADLGKGEPRQTQPPGGGVSLADVKAAGAAIVTETLTKQKPATPNDKVVPPITGTGPVNFEAQKEAPSKPVGEAPRPTVNDPIITPPPPSNPENKINPAPPQNPPSPVRDGPPISRTEPQPVMPNPPQEGQKINPAPPSADAGPPPPPPQPATPPSPTSGPAEAPTNPPPSQPSPVTPTPERIPDPIVTGPDSRPTVYVAEGPPVVINGEPYQTMTRTVWCPDCGPKGGPVVEVVTAAEQAAMKGAAADGIDPKLAALYKQQNTEKEFKVSAEEHVHGPGCGHDIGNGNNNHESHEQGKPVSQTPIHRVEISTPNSGASEPGGTQFSVNRFNANSEAANNAGSSTRQRRQANIKAPAPDPS